MAGIMKGYLEDLASIGQTSSDIFAHVSKAYEAVPSKTFPSSINTKVEAHNDCTSVLTILQLMDLVKAKYDEMKIDETWSTKDEQEEQIAALTAKLEQVQLSHEQLKKKLQAVNNQKKQNSAKRGQQESFSAMNNLNKKPKLDDSKWKWKEEPPRPGQTKRLHHGKSYYWCTYHKKWCLHTEAECRLKGHGIVGSNEIKGIARSAVYELH